MTLIPLQVTFRGLAHSDALDTDIRKHVARLERFHQGIVGCRVLVVIPHGRQTHGRLFHVRIELTVAGGAPIVVSHEPPARAATNDDDEAAYRKSTEVGREQREARVAIRQAFDAAQRQLKDFVREQRHAVKTHEAQAL